MVSSVQRGLKYLGWLEIILGCGVFLFGNWRRAAELVIAGVGFIALKHVIGFVYVILLGVKGQVRDVLRQAREGRRPSPAQVARPAVAFAAAFLSLTTAFAALYATLMRINPRASFWDLPSGPTAWALAEFSLVGAATRPVLAALYLVSATALLLAFSRAAADGH